MPLSLLWTVSHPKPAIAGKDCPDPEHGASDVAGEGVNSGRRNGTTLSVDYCVVFDLVDGRIVSGREHFCDPIQLEQFWSQYSARSQILAPLRCAWYRVSESANVTRTIHATIGNVG